MDLSVKFSKVKDAISSFFKTVFNKTVFKKIVPNKKPAVEPISTVIAVDMKHSAFHYYSKLDDENNTVVHHVKNYAGAAFDEEFYTKFKEAIAGFAADEPSDQIRRVTLILPDETVAIDNLRLPTLKTAKLINNALDVKISEIYSNSEELKILTHPAEKNKQYCTFNVASMKKVIIDTMNAMCSEGGMLAEAVTYSSASTVAALTALDHTLGKGSFLFLDLKDVYSRFIFVNEGRAVGFYTLPFGMEYLSSATVVGEDMICDHTKGELAVLNAREKAKAKKLSVLKELNGEQSQAAMDLEATLNLGAEPESEGAEVDTNSRVEISAAKKEKIMQKKAPRKLPIYMQRPIPETREGVISENFRVFVKYALMLIRSNPILTAIGAPAFVSVNLPESYNFIFTALAAEEKETGIQFVRFSADEDVAKNLELYGGLRPDLWHSSAKF